MTATSRHRTGPGRVPRPGARGSQGLLLLLLWWLPIAAEFWHFADPHHQVDANGRCWHAVPGTLDHDTEQGFCGGESAVSGSDLQAAAEANPFEHRNEGPCVERSRGAEFAACDLQWSLVGQEGAALDGPSEGLPGVFGPVVERLRPNLRRLTGEPRFRLAPKGSPPA